MTRILIARHGNTFNKGDIIRRVGITDLALSKSGHEQAKQLGLYLKQFNINGVFVSQLKRTKQTAIDALHTAGISVPIEIDPTFNEINYGIDENKPEEDVVNRIGREALDNWDKHAIVPNGWLADPKHIIQSWYDFAAMLLEKHVNQTILVVTSNGIARFAPYLTEDYDGFCKVHKLKMVTGALSSLGFDGRKWTVDFWNRTM